MIGREAYDNPYLFSTVDQLFWNENIEVNTRREIIKRYIPYVEENLSKGIGLNSLKKSKSIEPKLFISLFLLNSV